MKIKSDAAHRPCRILGFSDTFGAAAGNGVARFLEDLIRLANRRRLPLQLVVPSRGKSLSGVEAIRSPDFVVPGYGSLAISMPLKHHRKRIERLVKQQRPDCIHVSTPGPFGCFGVSLARRYNIPLVGIYHSDFPGFAESITRDQLAKLQQRPQEWFAMAALRFWPILLPWYQALHQANPRLSEDLGSLLEIWNRNIPVIAADVPYEAKIASVARNVTAGLMRNFYSSFDTVVARSTAQRAPVAETLNVALENIASLVPGTDINRFHPQHRDRNVWSQIGIPAADFVVLYVGRITAEKNIDFLFDLWQRVSASNRRVGHLVMVGHADDALRTRAKDLDNVRLIGSRGGEELSRLYASADLVVFPSVTETLGQVGLEAGASGVPVIVSDQGGPSMYVRHGQTGYALPTSDPQMWVNQILTLRDQPRLRHQLGRAARTHIETHYSIDRSVDSYWQIHEQAVAARRQRRRSRRRHDRAGNDTADPAADFGRPGVMFISDFHAGKRYANEAQRHHKQHAIRAMLSLAIDQDLEVIFGGDFGDHGSRTSRLEADFAALRDIRRELGFDGKPIFIRGNHDYGFSDQRLDELMGGCRVQQELAYHHAQAGVTATHGHILALARTIDAMRTAAEPNRLLGQLREDLLDEDLKPAVIAYDIANIVEAWMAGHGLHGISTAWEGLFQARAVVADHLLKLSKNSTTADEATWKMIAGLVGTHDHVETAAMLGVCCGGWASLFGHTHESLAKRTRVAVRPESRRTVQIVANSGHVNCKRPTCVVARFPRVTVLQFDPKRGKLLPKHQCALSPAEISRHVQLADQSPNRIMPARESRKFGAA